MCIRKSKPSSLRVSSRSEQPPLSMFQPCMLLWVRSNPWTYGSTEHWISCRSRSVKHPLHLCCSFVAVSLHFCCIFVAILYMCCRSRSYSIEAIRLWSCYIHWSAEGEALVILPKKTLVPSPYSLQASVSRLLSYYSRPITPGRSSAADVSFNPSLLSTQCCQWRNGWNARESPLTKF